MNLIVTFVQFSKWNILCSGLKSTLDVEVIRLTKSCLFKRFDEGDVFESRFSFEMVGKLIDEFIKFPIILLFPKDSAMYPSATSFDFHPRCLFNVSMLAPLSTSIVAEVRRKLWPVYVAASGKSRNSAICFGVLENLFFPITCVVHLPFW